LVNQFLMGTKRLSRIRFGQPPVLANRSAAGHDDRPLWLNKPAKLFAWIDGKLHVNWRSGPSMITQERFYYHLTETAQQFDALEMYPHWPPMPGVYYMHPQLPPSDGACLRRLLDEFRPATKSDRELIKAMLLTTLWGGPPGSRPSWVIAGPQVDPGGRRGVGKSTLVELVASLVGGFMSFTVHDSIDEISKRLLSPEGLAYRVTRIDNFKGYRLSWSELEALITSPVISGHRLYHGESQRKNTLTWTITLNGGKLSKDMAQRSMITRLARPRHTGNWLSRVKRFIHDNKWSIIADAIGLLQSSKERTP
jgi:hypothetical protein